MHRKIVPVQIDGIPPVDEGLVKEESIPNNERIKVISWDSSKIVNTFR